MIDIPEEHIVHNLRMADRRFALLTDIDLPAGALIPWWGAVLDHGDDAFGILVRLDERYAPDGWTALDLLDVAYARAQAEAARRPAPLVDTVVHQIGEARKLEAIRRRGLARAALPAFKPGEGASSYPWTVASIGGHELALCPDPVGLDHGVTPEQLLAVLDQLCADARDALPQERALRLISAAVGRALDAEARRAAFLRRAEGKGESR